MSSKVNIACVNAGGNRSVYDMGPISHRVRGEGFHEGTPIRSEIR
jgi:hypothetical protein